MARLPPERFALWRPGRLAAADVSAVARRVRVEAASFGAGSKTHRRMLSGVRKLAEVRA
jgi:hypothetical protein